MQLQAGLHESLYRAQILMSRQAVRNENDADELLGLVHELETALVKHSRLISAPKSYLKYKLPSPTCSRLKSPN